MNIIGNVILVIVLLQHHALSARPSFVVNGLNTKLGEIPYQLYLQYGNQTKWEFRCSAVLISPTQALTAAHCVDDVTAKELKVVASMVDVYKMKNAQIAYVKKIVIHPLYGKSEFPRDYDLAILTFITPFELNQYVQTIEWNDNENDTFAGERCVLSGWGETEYGKSSSLQKTKMKVISDNKCMGLTGSLLFSPRKVCVYQPFTGACYGDSGGPVTCKNSQWKPILVGIVYKVHLKFGECDTRKPVECSRVSHFKEFIRDNLI